MSVHQRPRTDDRAAGARLGGARRARALDCCAACRASVRARAASASSRSRTSTCRCPTASTCCVRASSGGSCRRWSSPAPSACSKSARAPGSSPRASLRRAHTCSSFELFADLADIARANLAAVGSRNVGSHHRRCHASRGPARAWRCGAARYHAIAVTGSLPVYDERFQRQLEIGGRLFVIVGDAPVMEARLVRRVSEDGWVTESLFETVVDPLINARRPPGFAF